MKTGQVEEAERRALAIFDKWNDLTGYVQQGCSYQYEMQSIIEDAVHIGIQMALHGKVSYTADGEVERES